MIEGKLGVEIEGVERVVGKSDGVVRVGVGERHCLFPPPRGEVEAERKGEGEGGEGGEKTVFLLSGEGTREVFRLDTVFFQNWYGYQDEVVGRGGSVDLVQVLSVSLGGAFGLFFLVVSGWMHNIFPPHFFLPFLRLPSSPYPDSSPPFSRSLSPFQHPRQQLTRIQSKHKLTKPHNRCSTPAAPTCRRPGGCRSGAPCRGPRESSSGGG